MRDTTRDKINKATLLTAMAAAEYLKVSRTTLYRLINDGKLKAVIHQGNKQYRVADLDELKPQLLSYAGKRGKPTDIARATDKDQQLIELAKQEEIAHDILDAMGIDPNLSQTDAENLLRKQITVLASRNKFVAKLFALLASPSEATQLRAAGLIKDIILPTRKEVKHTPGEEWKKTIDKMGELVSVVHDDMQKLFGPPPVVVDGEVIPSAPPLMLPAIEVD